ncbi:MAG: DUF1295 domain-containing protein [Bacilli bacterium]|nr:DUF1295 domain-containing protein [Bacilli bacterium]
MNETKKFKTYQSWLVMGISYLLATAAVILSGIYLPLPWYWSLFIGDVIGTLIIWVFSIVFDNVSIYDPYWSYMPWVYLLFVWIKVGNYNLYTIIFFAAFTLWSWRLNINWAIRFKEGLNHEDWRYTMWREKTGKAFHLFSLVSFMMMETVVIYAATMPAMWLFTLEVGPLSIIGSVVVLLGFLLELFSDIAMERSHKIHPHETCQIGLWKYSRHPNYLGENCVWFGTMLSLLIPYVQFWYMGVGFLAVLVLFLAASIPMMEKRQLERRSDYLDYKKRTSMFLLWFPKKHK